MVALVFVVVVFVCFFEGGSYYIANTNPELFLSSLRLPSVGITGLHHCILGLNAPSHHLFLGEIILEECVRVHVGMCAGHICAMLYGRSQFSPSTT